ncbi:GIY-YIG nuclease family protein [Stenotrophomonas acidaminiphila]
MLELNDLLSREGIAPERVMVMRHRPAEKELREVLPWMAAERHAVYNAYQSSHGQTVERALTKAAYLASFIGHAPGRAVFAGLYEVAGQTTVTVDEFWSLPGNDQLRRFGIKGPSDGRDSLWFDLRVLPCLSAWKGKLVIRWSGIERSWWRWAVRNQLPVHAIHEESLLVPEMPDWQTLSLGWRELQLLPDRWRTALAQWRGVYYIFDREARMGYVGSASGSDNLLGRWLDYAAKGDGGNRLLRGRNPENFAFGILQRVSPDMPAAEVVAVEQTWKKRLQTKAPLGLNDN